MRTLVVVFFLLAINQAVAQNNEKAIKLFEERKYDEAASLLKSVKLQQPHYAEARFYLGRISFQQQKHDDARTYFEEAITANGSVAEYHFWLGNALGSIAQNANPFKQGILAPKIKAAFEKTVELDPRHLGAHQGLIEFYTQAPGFMGGSWDKAEATARNIQKIHKADGHRALGLVYLRQEKFADAEREYSTAYKTDPTYAFVLANFYTGRKEFDKAFSLFEEMIARNADDMAAAYQYGKTSALSGLRLDEGERHLNRYFSYTPKPHEPSHAGAHLRLGQIKEKRGQKAEAKIHYQKAIAMDASMKEAKEGLERVR